VPRLCGEVGVNEPWLDRRKLADHLSVSERTVDYWRDDGLPEWVLGGRAKFKLSEVEPWLVDQGHLRQVRPYRFQAKRRLAERIPTRHGEVMGKS
jgi:hypothetical protein